MQPPDLAALLALHDAERARGRTVTAAELCPGDPFLAGQLQALLDARRIAQPSTQDGLLTVAGHPSPHAPLTGPTAPPGYEILGELGRGGMGVVYRARQLSLDRVVALKMILAGEHSRPDERARLLDEARAVAAVADPGVVQVFECGTHAGLPYFIMEFCPGGSLGERMRTTAFSAEQAADLVRQVAASVHAAHRAGVVHRDLKPGNILFDAAGRPRVTDFGLARRTDGAQRRTASGAIMGTAYYMAPEQARGEKNVGPAADVYALGSILFELLTGRPPFQGPTVHDTLHQVVYAEPVSACSLNPELPADLAAVCARCLNKAPDQRYASAADLAEDLRRWSTGEPLARWRRRRRWRPVALAVAAGLIVAVALGVQRGWFVALGGGPPAVQGLLTPPEPPPPPLAELQPDHARRVAAGLRAWEAGEDPEKALAGADARLAGAWESRWLRGLAAVRPVAYSVPGKKTPQVVAFSPDGRRVATGGADRTVRVWDAGSDRLLRTFEVARAGGEVRAVAFSPDGRRVAAADAGGGLTVWDAAAGGEPTAVATGVRGGLHDLAYSPDGTRIALAGADGLIQVYDTRSGALTPFTAPGKREVLGLDWSPDGRWIATGAADGLVRVADVGRGETVSTTPAPRKGQAPRVRAVAWGEGGTRLASGGDDGVVRVWVWDGAALTPEEDLPGHRKAGSFWLGQKGGITAVAFSPDGARLASGGGDGVVRVWDRRQGRELGHWTGPSGVRGLAFSPDGKRLLVGDSAGGVAVRLVDAGRLVPQRGALPGHPGGAYAVAVLGGAVASAGADGLVRVRDALTGSDRFAPVKAGGPVAALAWGPEGAWLAAAGSDGTVRILDGASGAVRHALPTHTGRVRALATCAGGLLASGGEDGRLMLWDARAGRLARPLETGGEPVWALAASPDGRLLASGGANKQVTIRDAATGAVRRTIAAPAGVLALAWSRDGRTVAAGHHDGTAALLDPLTGEVRHSLTEPTGRVYAVAFSPDGTRLALAGWEPVVRLFDVESGVQKLALPGLKTGAYAVAFGPAGESLFAGSAEGPVEVWDAPPP